MRIKGIVSVILLGLLCHLSVTSVHAEEITEELPVIVRWDNGNGYDKNDRMLIETWAYDKKNAAGRYVQFNEDGSVLQKCESMGGGSIEDNFTSTELDTAKIAFRMEGFVGFGGIVRVTIEEKSGVTKQYALTPDNRYEWNADVNSGDYKVIHAEAYDNRYVYKTIFSPERYPLAERAILMVKVKVLEEQIGKVTEELQRENSKEPNKHEIKREELHEEQPQKTTVNKYMLLSGMIILILLVWLIVRSNKKQYN